MFFPRSSGWAFRPKFLVAFLSIAVSVGVDVGFGLGQEIATRAVDGQPLGANVERVITAFDNLGFPLPPQDVQLLKDAARRRDALAMQEILDTYVLFVVSLNPEVRVKVARGPAEAQLQQSGWVPQLIKVLNDSTVTRELRILSENAGPVYSGAADGILERQAQTELNRNANTKGATNRFLNVEMYEQQPMTARLSGLEVEYAIAQIYCSESGKREATIGFDVGTGTQDIGFRGEVPVLFNVEPAHAVRLNIADADGQPTTARLVFRDASGHVYPSQYKRLAPDFFFQPQIYRADGETVLLPPGEFELTSCRGPEYVESKQQVVVKSGADNEIQVRLSRWVNPREYGFFCGDHHIHGAGCSHYDNPTQGVTPRDMFAQVKGEGLNVGCVLTWGPCFDYQRNFFSPLADSVSEDETILKYDLEISGFGSGSMGHVCLLRLRDQTYPGSEGSKTKGWPTWTVPVMRWAKEQGGVTGYPHSAMRVNPEVAAKRMIDDYAGDDRVLTKAESEVALLPYEFSQIDRDQDGSLTLKELREVMEEAADQLPNLCVPDMNGAGAMEICISTAEGVCDFVSAMDTERIPEWNTWYHILNCGFPLKLSGETDFPCMSSRRVGQGRVYVDLGEDAILDFSSWCEGLKRGQSYVSDGFAHALEFKVDGKKPGTTDVQLEAPGSVQIQAKVAFAPQQPRAVAYGGIVPPGGKRVVGDTVYLHAPRDSGLEIGGPRKVELIVNGKVVSEVTVEADGQIHALKFDVDIQKSSWIALRQFPQLHTNPVNVIVGRKPIRASAESARWCEETIHLLWKNRKHFIAESEQPAARAAYDRAIEKYQQIAAEASTD